MTQVTIKTLPQMRLAALEHQGAYPAIGKSFQQLATIFTARGFWPHARGMAAVYFSDVTSVPEDELRSVAAVRVGDSFPMPDDLLDMTIGGVDCAIWQHRGAYSGLRDAWDGLYGTWLPKSGREPADIPPFEIYLNDPTDTAPDDLLTDICIPLR